MLKGLSVGILVIVAAIPIPIVHFIAVPIAPFLAGYFGGGVAKVEKQEVTYFGIYLALLALLPAMVLLLLGLVSQDKILGIPPEVVIAAAIALVPYVWFGATIGALVNYLLRKRSARNASA